MSLPQVVIQVVTAAPSTSVSVVKSDNIIIVVVPPCQTIDERYQKFSDCIGEIKRKSVKLLYPSSVIKILKKLLACDDDEKSYFEILPGSAITAYMNYILASEYQKEIMITKHGKLNRHISRAASKTLNIDNKPLIHRVFEEGWYDSALALLKDEFAFHESEFKKIILDDITSYIDKKHIIDERIFDIIAIVIKRSVIKELNGILFNLIDELMGSNKTIAPVLTGLLIAGVSLGDVTYRPVDKILHYIAFSENYNVKLIDVISGHVPTEKIPEYLQ
jgi:hypothetical protein